MKLGSTLFIVSAFNSFICVILGLAMLIGEGIEPNWAVGGGVTVLGIFGLASFFWFMVKKLKPSKVASKQIENLAK